MQVKAMVAIERQRVDLLLCTYRMMQFPMILSDSMYFIGVSGLRVLPLLINGWMDGWTPNLYVKVSF